MVDRRRQWRAEKQNIQIIENLHKGGYVVSGSQGDEYLVDLHPLSCECQDWRKRAPNGGCKHILKVKLEQGAINPLPDAKTNPKNLDNRSASNYSIDWESISKRTKRRDNWTCQRCSKRGGHYGNAVVHAHHILPKSKGGQDSVQNLITICKDCHEQEHGHPIPSSNGFNNSSLSSRASGSKKSAGHTAAIEPHAGLKPKRGDSIKNTESASGDTNPVGGRHRSSHNSYWDDDPNSTKPSPEMREKSDSTSYQNGYISEECGGGDPAGEAERQLGLISSVIFYIIITAIFWVILPPFFATPEWKGGVALLIIACLFAVQAASNNETDYRRTRNLVGVLLYFLGAIITLNPF